MSSTCPLISIALITYNQSRFIEEAVISLLNQDYPNFEIVLFDDCSTDDTFEKAKKIIDAQENNYISVRLYKNEKNIGISGNVSRALKECKGEFIALAAGDDISHKDRLSKSLSFLEKKSNRMAVFSNATLIDDDSSILGKLYSCAPAFCSNIADFKEKKKVWALGASLFFKKEIYHDFGGFLENTFQEDGCLAFRSILKGDLCFLDDCLISYRIHGSNASQNLTLNEKVMFKHRDLVIYDNMIKDYYSASHIDIEVYNEIIRRRIFGEMLSKILCIKPLAFVIFSTSSLRRKFLGFKHIV